MNIESTQQQKTRNQTNNLINIFLWKQNKKQLEFYVTLILSFTNFF